MSNKINNTRKIKDTKTAEERRAQAERLQASIADQVLRRHPWLFLARSRVLRAGQPVMIATAD